MKSEQFDGRETRRVLAGMVTDQTVCSRIASQWPSQVGEGLFDSQAANMIAGWCIRHLRRYGEPPNGKLQGIFERWSASGRVSEEKARAVEKMLGDVSDQHGRGEKTSPEYLLDVAGRLFNRVRVQQTIEQAQDSIAAGQVDEAYGSLVSLPRVDLSEGSVVKAAQDFMPWRQAYDSTKARPLFSYPGDLDKFLGSAMVRGRFIAWMAPDKSLKSFQLLDAAYRAVRARCRVAYIEAGDMTQDDVLLRLGERAARRPRRKRVWWVPTGIVKAEDGYEVDREKRKQSKALTPGEAFKAFRKTCRGRDVFRISCHPNSSIDVDGIGGMLRDWAREGWVADVVAIDYADILAPPRHLREAIDQVDWTWKSLRRMSQELDCLVLTATQSNAAAYSNSRGMLSKKHFSGRKTKLAHVNGMLGINITDEEREQGIFRLNWVVRREARYSERECVAVTGCLDIASPSMKSVKG